MTFNESKFIRHAVKGGYDLGTVTAKLLPRKMHHNDCSWQKFQSIFSLFSTISHKNDTVHDSTFCTSICIFRWTLKCESKVRKMASESSNTSGTEETPFLDSATHRYCLMALTNISWVRNTGPAPCSTESNSCRETTLERNSWDLEGRRMG